MCALDNEKAWRRRPLDGVAISTLPDRRLAGTRCVRAMRHVAACETCVVEERLAPTADAWIDEQLDVRDSPRQSWVVGAQSWG
jgi:hypothetical protein